MIASRYTTRCGIAPTRTRTPSIAAIHSVIRSRFARSREGFGSGWSRAVTPDDIALKTLPRWPREPALAGPREDGRRVGRRVLVAEEAVDRRAGAAHVGAEGAELAQPPGEPRPRE